MNPSTMRSASSCRWCQCQRTRSLHVSSLAQSSEPATVFASLAGLCVPSFTDACHVAVGQPPNSSDPPLYMLGTRSSSTFKAATTRADAVVITVGEPDTDDGEGCSATVVFT